MKVLVVGHSLRGGGAEFVTRTWISYLEDQGDEIRSVMLDDALHTSGEHILQPPGTLRTILGIQHWSKLSMIRKEIREFRPDVCLAMQTYPNLLLIAATRFLKKQQKIVISERNVPSALLRNEGKSQRFQLFLAKRLYRQADTVIAISHPVAADLTSAFKISREKCVVVPNPASAKTASPRVTRRIKSSSTLTVVLPFRLVEQKRPLVAIDVACELSSMGHKVNLLSFGVGPLSSDFLEKAKSNNVDVRMAGWDELWFDKCPPNSVVLLPSYCEGFGNVLVEAGFAGIPSVAWSGALGVADAIVPGVTGILTGHRDARSLAEAVLSASQIKVSAPAGWLHYFSPLNSGRRLRDALNRCATEN